MRWRALAVAAVVAAAFYAWAEWRLSEFESQNGRLVEQQEALSIRIAEQQERISISRRDLDRVQQMTDMVPSMLRAELARYEARNRAWMERQFDELIAELRR